jgi:DHA1 family multidrug resistance protein-like MFS transporter
MARRLFVRVRRFASFGRAGDRVPLPRDVRVLGVVAFFVMLGFGVVVPVLPVFVRSFHVGYVEVGAVVSAFALMRLIANPFVGWVVDRVGERTVLAIGIGIVALSSGLVGIAVDYPQVLVLRGVGGIGSAMFSVAPPIRPVVVVRSASTRVDSSSVAWPALQSVDFLRPSP